jgi:hypothetical protein
MSCSSFTEENKIAVYGCDCLQLNTTWGGPSRPPPSPPGFLTNRRGASIHTSPGLPPMRSGGLGARCYISHLPFRHLANGIPRQGVGDWGRGLTVYSVQTLCLHFVVSRNTRCKINFYSGILYYIVPEIFFLLTKSLLPLQTNPVQILDMYCTYVLPTELQFCNEMYVYVLTTPAFIISTACLCTKGPWYAQAFLNTTLWRRRPVCISDSWNLSQLVHNYCSCFRRKIRIKCESRKWDLNLAVVESLYMDLQLDRCTLYWPQRKYRAPRP